MGFGNPAGDGKSEAGAAGIAFGARPGFVGAEKALEDARLEFSGNSRAGIGDAKDVVDCVEAAVYVDHSTGGRVFDGVVDEIQQHAAEKILVGGEGKLRLDRGGKRDAFCDGEGARAAENVCGQFIEVEITEFERVLACISTGERCLLYTSPSPRD